MQTPPGVRMRDGWMLKRGAWQLAPNATGTVTRGREEKETEHPGAGTQERLHTYMGRILLS